MILIVELNAIFLFVYGTVFSLYSQTELVIPCMPPSINSSQVSNTFDFYLGFAREWGQDTYSDCKCLRQQHNAVWQGARSLRATGSTGLP